MDQADLDFGIYRIMNQKRDEITRFLDHDLLPQVKAAFAQYQSADKKSLQDAVDAAWQSAINAGFDPELSPKVVALREQMTQYTVDVPALENEVYSHLYNFFRRYYQDGDFISIRRYKEGVYAIPYEGEEVKLHWANADQYYIKTSESFRDYAFRLPDGRLVHFKVVEAETDRDNVKSEAEKDRRFMLAGDGFWSVDESALTIRFEFRADAQKRDQKTLNVAALQAILACLPADWAAGLQTLAPTEASPRRTLLEKHLSDYTARNTFDYFIHKDLRGFLRRELDFYIKNEVMRLDDIENQSAPKVEEYLSLVKALRSIAHKIIDFLAQIEDFQKKLWLKKKFVVETNYCITLDRVPEELYPEICTNAAQREEWVHLFAIDGMKGDLVTPGYSEPLTVEFLQANPFLVLDTKFFSLDFVNQLLANIENLDDQIDGLLIHGENFQALNLLQNKYRRQIKCIYIDPPYNTELDRKEGKFIYKDTYEHSSWLSMMSDRLLEARNLLVDDGVIFMSIDDNEAVNLKKVCDQIFGIDNYLNTVSAKMKNIAGASGGGEDKRLKKNIEFVLIYTKDYEQFSAFNKVYNYTEIIELLDYYRVEDISWKYTSVITNLGQKDYELSTTDGDGNEIRVYRRLGATFSSVNELIRLETLSEDQIYHKYFERIFTTAMPQSSIRGRVLTALIENNLPLTPDSVYSIEYIPKSGRNKGQVYEQFYRGEQLRLFSWFRDVAEIRDDKVYKKDLIGTLWDGLNLNNLTKEGGVRFTNGKKPVDLLNIIITMATDENSLVLDYFAGSATTAHAVINLNRSDQGKRKYIVIEIGQYFNTITKPRIQNVIYSIDWKDDKPVSRQGSSHCFKYLRLESYEDALNNLVIQKPNAGQQLALNEATEFREDYMLSYLLEVESRSSLLNINSFIHPFNYQMNIAAGIVGESTPTVVDLVETFNYLIGLHVQTVQSLRGFRIVTGRTPAGEHTLIIWRDLEEKSNADLEDFFRRQEYNPRDSEFDLIYVNGDNNLENLRRPDETWKVRLIEEDFLRLMFETDID